MRRKEKAAQTERVDARRRRGRRRREREAKGGARPRCPVLAGATGGGGATRRGQTRT